MKKIIFLFIAVLPIVSFAQSYPKMSTWDGVAYAIKDYFKANANDPKSIKYEEASLMMKFSNGEFAQRVKIRGKNAFNALVLSEQYFILSGTGDYAKVKSVFDKQEFELYVIRNSVKIVQKWQPDGTIVP